MPEMKEWKNSFEKNTLERGKIAQKPGAGETVSIWPQCCMR